VNCNETGAGGSAHESLTLDAKISRQRPRPFTTGIALGMKMTPGGRWSMSGSYAPVQEGPTGGPTCGTPKGFGCGGAITREGAPMATLAFMPHGRSLLGNFLQAPSFHERRPNEDQPCSLDDSVVEPMFGLDGTEIEVDALAESDAHPSHFVVPRSKFKGRKAFTVTHVGHPDEGCPRDYYTQCTETGTITLELRFSHPR